MSENVNELFNQLWIEKYRPQTIDDVVLNDKQKIFIKKCLEKREIPHLLFFGPPGSGKTTLARIIVNDLIDNEMDVLYLNGSDTTGVDVVRELIVPFLKTPPMGSSLKVVYIDEMEYLSKNAQASLRNTMETYASNGRFIFTANYSNKIIDPLLSRLTSFEMKSMPKEFVINFIKNILQKENVTFNEKDIDSIVSSFLPDVRKIVNYVQQHVENNKLQSVKSEELVTIENKIIGLIIEECDIISTGKTDIIAKVTNKIYPSLLASLNGKDEPDICKIYEILFNHESIPAWAKIKIINFANKHASSFNEKMNFMSCAYDILYAGIQFNKLIGIVK